MDLGTAKECPHCGSYDKGFCKAEYPGYSCSLCLKAAGLDPEKDAKRMVLCSVCGGKHWVWIGPNVTSLNIDHQILELSDALAEKLDEIIEQQENIMDSLTSLSESIENQFGTSS